MKTQITIEVDNKQTRKCKCYDTANSYFTVADKKQAGKYARLGFFEDVEKIAFAPWVSEEEIREILSAIFSK